MEPVKERTLVHTDPFFKKSQFLQQFTGLEWGIKQPPAQS